MRIREFANPLLLDLARHTGIGWDVDKTLINDPASETLQEFIKNHPRNKNCIVTYRTHGLVSMIFPDLSLYPAKLKRSNFSAVFSVNQDLWIKFKEDEHRRKYEGFNGPLTETEIEYIEWKPKICHENGLTALVDDRIDLLTIPCRKYGIELYNPKDFRNY